MCWNTPPRPCRPSHSLLADKKAAPWWNKGRFHRWPSNFLQCRSWNVNNAHTTSMPLVQNRAVWLLTKYFLWFRSQSLLMIYFLELFFPPLEFLFLHFPLCQLSSTIRLSPYRTTATEWAGWRPTCGFIVKTREHSPAHPFEGGGVTLSNKSDISPLPHTWAGKCWCDWNTDR